MVQLSKDKLVTAYTQEGIEEFLKLLTDTYLDFVDNDLSAENMDKLTGYQHALLAYRYFREEVNQGGFVQLIQNGYGGYIFNNPTAKALKLFGASETAKIIYKAAEIYRARREELERETTEEEFMAMFVLRFHSDIYSFIFGLNMSSAVIPHSFIMWIQYSSFPKSASVLLVPKVNFNPAAFAFSINGLCGIR
jgi:hypothetical protein